MTREKVRGAMHTNPGWILVAPFAVVMATVSPGIGLAVASISHTNGANVVSPVGTISSVASANWAGYAALGSSGTVTKVTGTWTEPAITCSGKYSTTDVATWVGIDGYSNGNLVQTGASADCSGTSVSYYAWWEVLPASETTIGSFPVHSGDKITASVTYVASTGKYTMKITDGTQTFSHVRTLKTDPRTSAECIVERDYIGVLNHLSKFKTDKFSSCTATISGTSGAIGTFGTVSDIAMTNNAGTKIIATTSTLTSNKAFTVTWKAYG